MRLTARLLGLLLLTLLLVGCGGKSIYPVKGRVHFSDGTPLETGRVVIDTGREMTGSWGLIRPDGTFNMGTHSSNDGVPAGKHQIFIQNAVTAPPSGFTGTFTPKPLIHPRFMKSDTSGLSFEVPAQVEWDIVVEKP